MSPIAGFWRLDGSAASHGPLDAMVEQLAHQGSHRTGTRLAGPAALAHRTLHPTADWRERPQPLEGDSGSFLVTADARIDNRPELIRALGLAHRAGEIGDAELILQAYEEWGEGCPERLIGDFAFAIWDGRRHKMFCARDSFGVRPVYYHYRPFGLFAFASEMGAVLGLPDVDRVFNDQRAAAALLLPFEDMESTHYRDILRLPPAHALAVGPGWVRRWQYGKLERLTSPPSPRRVGAPA